MRRISERPTAGSRLTVDGIQHEPEVRDRLVADDELELDDMDPLLGVDEQVARAVGPVPDLEGAPSRENTWSRLFSRSAT